MTDPKPIVGDWDSVTRQVMSRAHHRCECTGECGFNHRYQQHDRAGKPLPALRCRVPHGFEILRKRDWPTHWILGPTHGPQEAIPLRPLYRDEPVKGEQTLLVVEPVDGDRRNRVPTNVLALCQRCAILISRRRAA